MSSSTQYRDGGASSPSDFEETLRLIAHVATPEGLEERVHARLKAAPAASRARILAWPGSRPVVGSWLRSTLARSAAAAAIVAVVLGGSWAVYSRVEAIQPVRAITVPLNLSRQGGFSSAGARRTPQTLNGPKVPPPSAAPNAAQAIRPKGQITLPQNKPAATKAAPRPVQ